MNALNRLADIINANLNALLDKAEQPEKMLRLLVQEMDESLVELRTLAAEHIAQRKQLQRQLMQQQVAVDDWQQKAERALAHDKDDLARAALTERFKAEQQQSRLQDDAAQVQSLLDDIEGDMSRLQGKLNEAKQRYQQLQRRADCSEVRLQLKTQQHQQQMDGVMQKYQRFEQKIEGFEAQLEAYALAAVSPSSATLQQQFRSMERDEAIEQVLTTLKKKQGKKESAHA